MTTAVIQAERWSVTPDEPTPDQVSWRLREVEKKVDRLETRVADGVAGLSTQIAGLDFVRSDMYVRDQRSAEKEMAALLERIEATDRHAMWAIALVCTVTIGAIITAILSAGGTFG